MTRHIVAVALAAIVFAAPTVSFAQATNSDASSYADTKPRRVAPHKSTTQIAKTTKVVKTTHIAKPATVAKKVKSNKTAKK